MSELIYNFDLFYEILDSLFGKIPFSKHFNSYLCAKPFTLIDISIAPSTNEVILSVEDYLLKLNKEVKATGFEALDESQLC